MILVTAANGNQGKLLVPKLVAAGLRVRACVRSEESAELLRAGGVNDIIVGDIGDAGVIKRAVAGVDKVYHIGPFGHVRERELGCALIDAARMAGVQHFVFSSVLHAITTDLIQHAIKRDVEEHLLSSGLEFTILQPANYMMPLKLASVFAEGIFRLSWSLERHQSLVDLDDVTDVAFAVLTESPRHAGATYELVAPGRYTAHDLGEIIARVLGKAIPVEEIAADAYARVFPPAPPASDAHRTRVLRAITKRYSRHDFIGNANVLTWLLGRAPTGYEAFVRREHAAYCARRRSHGVGSKSECLK